MSDGADATEELVEAASSSQDRRRSNAAPRADRNVRPRLEKISVSASEGHL